MNCDETRKSMLEFLDGELPEDMSRAVGAHLRSCFRCSEKAAELRASWDLLDLYPAARPSENFTAATVAAFRAVRRRERIASGMRRASLLLAASIMAVLAVFLFDRTAEDPGATVAVTEDEVIENLDLIEDLELLEQLGDDLDMAMEYDLFVALGGEESF